MEFVRYYLGPEGMVLPEAFLDGSCARNGPPAQHLFSCPTVLVGNIDNYCTCSSILGPLCRYALPFWDHCALPLGDEYMRDAEEIFRLQNGQDQRNHENTRRTLNIRDMWAGTDFSACF